MQLKSLLTAKQIIKCLEENETTPGNLYFYHRDVEHFGDESDSELIENIKNLTKKIGPFKVIYENGGGEGEGDTIEVVWYFMHHNIYLRSYGFYDSWNGDNWEGAEFEEVKPKAVKKNTIF